MGSAEDIHDVIENKSEEDVNENDESNVVEDKEINNDRSNNEKEIDD